jgi:hypothetical protein
VQPRPLPGLWLVLGNPRGDPPPGGVKKYYVQDVPVSAATERVQYLDERGKFNASPFCCHPLPNSVASWRRWIN